MERNSSNTTDINQTGPLTFTPLSLSLMERTESIRRASGSTLYVYTFASLFAWQAFEQYEICFGEDAFLIKNGASGDEAYLFPCGAREGQKRLLDALVLREKPVFYSVTDDDRRFLETAYPGRFLFTDCRDEYPYLYDRAAQIALAGKEYKSLRHQVNLGRAVAQTWTAEPLADGNIDRALALTRRWAEERSPGDLADTGAAETALRHFSALSLWGILFQADGADIAYAAGPFITPGIFDIAFCKVLDKRCDCFIKWALYRALPPEVKTVDSEDDMGVLGLRTHKLLHRPKEERYYEMLNMLFDIKDSNDILYLYVQKLDGDTVTYLFDADRADDRCQLGTTHEISGPAKAAEHPENGIPAFITNDAYGWLCTSAEPVRDADGSPVALVGVDISMDDIVRDRTNYLRNMILLMGGVAIVLSALILFGVNRALVNPINKLSDAARSFVQDRDGEQKDVSAVSRLQIRTGDEVETLCASIKQMEQDINSYIANLTAVTAEKERIGAELDVATHIQSSMLPSIFPAFPERPEFDIFATMDPAKEVGGDFYDFFMVDERHIAIVVADVSGKGVPAALFMVIGKTLIKDHTLADSDLSAVFAEVNDILCESNSEDLFITAFEGVLDLQTGDFRFVNAGHEPPFISRAGGRFELYKIKPGFVLAGMEGMRYKGGSFTLSPGDKLFLYTDGVTEATNAADALYGMERLETALARVADRPPEEILPAVKADIDAFVGSAPQFDDITMLCLSYKQPMREEE